MPTDYSQQDPQATPARQRTDYSRPDKAARVVRKPFVQRGAAAFHQLGSDLPLGVKPDDIVHPDPKRIAAHVVTGAAGPEQAAHSVSAVTNPTAFAGQAGGDVLNYILDPAAGGLVEHLVRGALGKDPAPIQMPPFLQALLGSMSPALNEGVKAGYGALNRQIAADPGKVAQTAGDIAPGAIPLPALEGAEAARGVGVLRGEAGEAMRDTLAARGRLGMKPVTGMDVPAFHGASSVLSQNPILGLPLHGAAMKDEAQVAKRAAELAQKRGGGVRRTPARAGEIVSEGLQRFQAGSPETSEAMRAASPGSKASAVAHVKSIPLRDVGFGSKSAVLYGQAEDLLGPLTHPISAGRTRAAVKAVKNAFDNPHLRELFSDPTVKSLYDILKTANGRMSFEDLRRLRTSFRLAMKNALKDPSIRGDLQEADIRRIYNAMTQDLQGGAEDLGRLWGGEKRAAAASKAWSRADAFYQRGMDRVDRSLSDFYGKDTTPADVFHSLMRTAQSGGKQDLDKLRNVRRSLSPDEWQAFTSTVVDQMGKPAPGAADADQEFSLMSFLTNYNKMNEHAQKETSGIDSGLKVLFEGKYGKDDAQVVKDMGRIASNFRGFQRGRNVSKTAHVLGGVLAPGLVGYMAHNPLATVITLGVGNSASLLLSRPGFVRWLARLPTTGTDAEVAAAKRQMQGWLASVGAETSQLRQQPDSTGGQ